jgi:tRNA-specific 2-thiouridylase
MQVLMAMSGGVDSSVAAALLLDAGHDVVGVTMKLWGGETDTGCCSVSDVDDARRVAQQLGIDHFVFNFTEEFNARVVAPYVQAHAEGRTPNPCIECNRHLKFDRLISRADQLGFDAVATGHHARVVHRPGGLLAVGRAGDAQKDQSYVLHMLGPAQLAKIMFPVGGYEKSYLRELATGRGLRTAAKPDSQDVCFITSKTGRETFLGSRIPLKPGRIVDSGGTPLGTVPAIELVNVGQRKGLDVSGGQRRYVLDVDVADCVVTVGSLEELMVADTGLCEVLVHDSSVVGGRVLAQVSAHGKAMAARFDGMRLVWDEPHKRVAPGQSVALYDLDDQCVVAGGVAT